jgi:hypothetical protein
MDDDDDDDDDDDESHTPKTQRTRGLYIFGDGEREGWFMMFIIMFGMEIWNFVLLLINLN